MASGDEPLSNGLGVLKERLEHVIAAQDRSAKQLDRIEQEMRYQFVTRSEFNRLVDSVVYKDGRYWLVEKLIFGIVGIVLIATLGAILANIGLGR